MKRSLRRMTAALFAALCAAHVAPAAETTGVAAARIEDASPERASIAQRLREISLRVQRASRYPAIAIRAGVSGEALVSFEVGPGGVPREVAIQKTSGSGALDEAARRAVAEASPLPFVYGRISVPVRFTLERR